MGEVHGDMLEGLTDRGFKTTGFLLPPSQKGTNSASLSVTLQSLEPLERNPRGARHKL